MYIVIVQGRYSLWRGFLDKVGWRFREKCKLLMPFYLGLVLCYAKNGDIIINAPPSLAEVGWPMSLKLDIQQAQRNAWKPWQYPVIVP